VSRRTPDTVEQAVLRGLVKATGLPLKTSTKNTLRQDVKVFRFGPDGAPRRQLRERITLALDGDRLTVLWNSFNGTVVRLSLTEPGVVGRLREALRQWAEELTT